MQKISATLKKQQKMIIALIGIIIFLIGIITLLNLLDSFLKGEYQDLVEYLLSHIILYEISLPVFGWFTISIGFSVTGPILTVKAVKSSSR